MRVDRSHYPTRKISLQEEGLEQPLAGLDPGQLVEMVWSLTLEAWTFKDGRSDEPRLRRDVGRVVRGRG